MTVTLETRMVDRMGSWRAKLGSSINGLTSVPPKNACLVFNREFPLWHEPAKHHGSFIYHLGFHWFWRIELPWFPASTSHRGNWSLYQPESNTRIYFPEMTSCALKLNNFLPLLSRIYLTNCLKWIDRSGRNRFSQLNRVLNGTSKCWTRQRGFGAVVKQNLACCS